MELYKKVPVHDKTDVVYFIANDMKKADSTVQQWFSSRSVPVKHQHRVWQLLINWHQQNKEYVDALIQKGL